MRALVYPGHTERLGRVAPTAESRMDELLLEFHAVGDLRHRCPRVLVGPARYTDSYSDDLAPAYEVVGTDCASCPG
jgi:hypothetical protein